MNPDVAVRSRTGHDKVASVETPDDHTVVMTLTEPFAPFQALWTSGVTGIIPAHILEGVDVNTAPFNTQSPIGTGPFRFVEHVGGDHLTVERNPDYHGGAPALQQVIVKLVPEIPVLFTQFRTGEVDVVDYQGLQPDRVEEALGLEDRVVVSKGSNFVEFIYFNNTLPQFQDKRVKQAIYHATDRQTVIDTIYYGLQNPTLTYLPPTHWAYNPDVKQYPYDLDAARDLCWTRRASSPAPTASASGTASASPSGCRPVPATRPERAPSSCSSRRTTRSASRCRSTTGPLPPSGRRTCRPATTTP
jgi:peptide/nickel transport system substrate-binding protein